MPPFFIVPFIGVTLGLLVLLAQPKHILGGIFALLVTVVLLVYLTPTAIKRLQGIFKQIQWWHVLWIMVFCSGLVFRVREADLARESPLDVWALYRITLMGVVGFILIQKLVLKRPDWLYTFFYGLPGILGIAAIWNLVSTIWSVYPAWTFYKSVEYFLDVSLLAAILAAVKTPEEFKSFFDWTWTLLALLSGTVLAGAFLWPDLSLTQDIGMLGNRLIGVYPAVSANGVGDLGAILACVSLARYFFDEKHKIFYVFVFLISLGLLIVAQTRSALGGFCVGAVLILVCTKRVGISTLILTSVMGIVLLTIADQLFVQYFLRGQDTDLLLSGTGRVGWWGFAWDRFIEQPFSGFGAYAAGRFAVLQNAGLGATATLHNSWLEVLLGVGFLGVLFLFLAVSGAWLILFRSIIKLQDGVLAQRLAIEALGVLAILSVRSLFDSLLIWHPALPFLAVIGLAEMLRQQTKGIFREDFARS